MTSSFGDEIKSRLTMKEVVNMYGFQVNRANTMLCPFHDDHNSSMHVYSGKRGFFCFACNTGGSVIDFVMKYFDLSFTDACKKLNEDFKLGIPIGEELTDQQKREAAEAVRKRQEEMRQKEKKEQQLFTAYHSALDRYCTLDQMKMENEPNKGADGKYRITKAYVYAIKRIDAAWADVEEAAAKLREFEKGENQGSSVRACIRKSPACTAERSSRCRANADSTGSGSCSFTSAAGAASGSGKNPDRPSVPISTATT